MILFLVLWLWPQTITRDTPKQFVAWNVGQGSSATLLFDHTCVHVDLGGESFPNGMIERCRFKKNILVLTHFDLDHINFISRARRELKNLCLATKPSSHISAKKQKIFTSLPRCHFPANIRQITHSRFKYSNESHAYVVNKNILITGDAPQKQENQIPSSQLQDIQFLLLGHHGSRTSTGINLLKRLPATKLAIASARKKRYGHPHKEVLQRLQKTKLPGVSTEDFGNIWLELN